MRWKGGERNSKEVRDIEMEKRKIFETLSEEGIERYMEMRKGDEKGRAKWRWKEGEVYRDDENEKEKSGKW